MKETVINGVMFRHPEEVSKEELTVYFNEVPEGASEVKVTLLDGGENVALDFVVPQPKFERIRRITGYLVGTIDRWNNAKQAEEHDRVKHGLASLT